MRCNSSHFGFGYLLFLILLLIWLSAFLDSTSNPHFKLCQILRHMPFGIHKYHNALYITFLVRPYPHVQNFECPSGINSQNQDSERDNIEFKWYGRTILARPRCNTFQPSTLARGAHTPVCLHVQSHVQWTIAREHLGYLLTVTLSHPNTTGSLTHTCEQVRTGTFHDVSVPFGTSGLFVRVPDSPVLPPFKCAIRPNAKLFSLCFLFFSLSQQ